MHRSAPRETSRVCPLRSLPLLCLCAVAVWGCRSQAEREASREIAQLIYMVGQLRDAPSNEKEEPLARLKQQPCSSPRACQLQQLCVQGYDLHTRALKTASQVRKAMNQGNADTAGAAQLLEMSQQDLMRAKGLTEQCVALEGELTREHL